MSNNYYPDFESLCDQLVEAQKIRSVDQLLLHVTSKLAKRSHVALVCIWFVRPADCCQKRKCGNDCNSQENCLHLVASKAQPLRDEKNLPLFLENEFHRIPIGLGKIGQVASTGIPLITNNTIGVLTEIFPREWVEQENIKGVNCQPIGFEKQILGVIAVVTRIPVPSRGPGWLRILANHIGALLTNMRAFQEIEHLKSQLELENTYLREEVREAGAFGEIIGESDACKTMLQQVDLVAHTDAVVLILGESGTGKELVAREIHKRSLRSSNPLIRVNCASVPKDLYESEFFGHVKGAFTGAIKDRAGRFEAADGGTLFLDEIGEIPLELQSKFLRVLQEKQYERVGEERTRTTNVRIVAATNRDLQEEVMTGHFRQDLFYRLNVFPLKVAPLRDRKDDIPLLATHFIHQAAQHMKLPEPRLSSAHLLQLQSYDWPGNIRELQNIIERAVILSQKSKLFFDLPHPHHRANNKIVDTTFRATADLQGEVFNEEERHIRDKNNILKALNRANWKIHGNNGAALLLGLSPSTLISRMKKLSIKRPTED